MPVFKRINWYTHKEARRLEKRAAEEIEEIAKDQARREAYLAREKAIAEAQKAKKLKGKK